MDTDISVRVDAWPLPSRLDEHFSGSSLDSDVAASPYRWSDTRGGSRAEFDRPAPRLHWSWGEEAGVLVGFHPRSICMHCYGPPFVCLHSESPKHKLSLTSASLIDERDVSLIVHIMLNCKLNIWYLDPDILTCIEWSFWTVCWRATLFSFWCPCRSREHWSISFCGGSHHGSSVWL